MTNAFCETHGRLALPSRPQYRRWLLRGSVPLGIALMAALVTPPASAVPAFTDQTGQPCQACHVGGFGPQLTPFGREFKLGGYTMRVKGNLPLAAMATNRPDARGSRHLRVIQGETKAVDIAHLRRRDPA